MKKITIALLIVALSAILVAPALANNIVIDPANPTVVNSPAELSVSIQSNDPAYDPIIFLVMTEESYNGMAAGGVLVEWDGGSVSLPKPWNLETGLVEPEPKVPDDLPLATGVGYTVSSLQSHLETTGSIYWAWAPFLGTMQLTKTPIDFTVTVPSTATKMLVYVLAKETASSNEWTDRVPPTNPGFVVPEVATILLAVSSFSALGLFALKRKQK